MGRLRSFVLTGFGLSLGLLSLAAWSLPKTTIENIQGFQVHFVDIGMGDSIGISFYTPYGTLNDHREKLGRAHLLEHILFTGSKLLPGHHTYDDTMRPAGADFNAHTDYAGTYYYASGPIEQRRVILKTELSMLTGLEWNATSYQNERDVVIDEVDSEYNKQESTAFSWMPFTQLLAATHPWARPLLGDKESLLNLSIEDLQNSYLQAYAPGVVSVAVFGNFSNPEVFADVRQTVSEMLDAQRIRSDRDGLAHPHKPTLYLDVPSLFSASKNAPESQRRLYIEAESLRQGMMILEIPVLPLTGKNITENESSLNFHSAVDLMLDYINLEVPGSVFYKLQTELAWVSSIGIYPYHFRNKTHLHFVYDLTEEGQKHVVEINEMFFRAVDSLSQLGPNPDILTMLKNHTHTQLETAGRSVERYVRFYEGIVREGDSADEVIKSVQSVTPNQVAQIAGLIRPDQALYVENGPAVADMSIDARFERAFKILDNRVDLAIYNVATYGGATREFEPSLRQVNLPPPSNDRIVSLFQQTRQALDASEKWVLDLRSNLPDYSAAVNLRLEASTPKTEVAVGLMLDAFRERYASELAYLSLNYDVRPISYINGNTLRLQVSGESRYASRALVWMIQELGIFTPANTELDRAKKAYRDSYQKRYASGFTASIGTDQVFSLMDPLHLTDTNAVKLAGALTNSEVGVEWRKAIQASDKQFGMVGAFAIQDFQDLHQTVANFSPAVLSPNVKEAMAKRFNWNDHESQELRFPFPEARSSRGLAAIRIYRGPELADFKESAVFLALNEVLNAKIYSHNREDQGLGYIHKSFAYPVDNKNLFLFLVGQAEGEEKVALTIAGWNLVLHQLQTGELSDEKLKDGILSLRNQLAPQRNSASDLLETYLGQQHSRGQARGRRKLMEAVDRLTVADVREMGLRLLSRFTVSTEVIYGECDKLLQ